MGKDYFLRGDDAHGQPQSFLNRSMRLGRSLDELIGICKGVIADGVVNGSEANFLKSWLEANPETAVEFPARHLTDRMARIFNDEVVGEEERQELLDLLKLVTGETEKVSTGEAKSTKIFFEDPEPEIIFVERAFAFTGKFVSGTRKWCCDQTASRGGIFHDKPRRETHFLVLGTGGSRDWIHSVFGRKIEQVLDYREKYGTKIVSEEHWVKYL